ncbi:hypothetical protein [Pseudomonas sp. URMO17WK12:I11]|uniref:hypothetical protein n=1 Tax=Pseudomonas sp. URMO17WK12:I11 TaxID=1283291 RepID=UPI0011A0A9F8|nr:hypothetical protein [Pseudomonas sp. URMO17WK12:I11]
MSAWALRAAGAGLLIVVGMLMGAWATTGHFRPLLDAEQNQVASCKAARDNLAGLATEQGKALGDLVLAANTRQAAAEQAVSQARASADLDYAAANRLQQERIGGDQCAAATVIIDKELGL